MENINKIHFKEFIERLKAKHEEQVAKNPDLFKTLKAKAEQTKSGQISFDEFFKKAIEAHKAAQASKQNNEQ